MGGDPFPYYSVPKFWIYKTFKIKRTYISYMEIISSKYKKIKFVDNISHLCK